MQMRRVLGICLIVLCCTVAAHGRSFTFVQAANNMALFTNETGVEVTTLVVVFSGDAEVLDVVGIGADIDVTSSAGSSVILEGTVPPFGVVQVEWALDGPGVAVAVWRSPDPLTIHAIDTLSPTANIVILTERRWSSGVVSLGLGALVSLDSTLEMTFLALGSSDPDGTIIEYLWEWSDGVTATGPSASRIFELPRPKVVTVPAAGLKEAAFLEFVNGWFFETDYTVRLTVTDDDGLSDSVTKTFTVGVGLPPSG